MHKRLILAVLAVLGGAALAANVIISPNMGLPVPVVGTDPGPDWANNINASLSIIDSHDHTPGYGVPVPPAGLNINSDLTFQSNNATNLRSTRFAAQGSPLSGGSDLGALYVSGADLYYNDEAGNQVRITQGGSVTGSAGTITGLPSGTASAAFSGATFSFKSATNTPAIMSVGPVTIGANAVSPKTVTIAPPGGLAANYNLTLPNGLPGATSLLQVDTSGNMSSTTTPTLTGGALSGTFTGSPAFSGTLTIATMGGNVVFTGTPQVDAGLNWAGGSFTGGVPNFAEGLDSAGQMLNEVGSAGAPSYSFTGDTSTGLYRSAASTMILASGGSNILQVGANVQISNTATGGNVPHGCSVKNSSVLDTVNTVSCSAGEIVTGGGCSTPDIRTIMQNYPVSATQWQCGYATTTTITAYAICCKY